MRTIPIFSPPKRLLRLGGVISEENRPVFLCWCQDRRSLRFGSFLLCLCDEVDKAERRKTDGAVRAPCSNSQQHLARRAVQNAEPVHERELFLSVFEHVGKHFHYALNLNAQVVQEWLGWISAGELDG